MYSSLDDGITNGGGINDATSSSPSNRAINNPPATSLVSVTRVTVNSGSSPPSSPLSAPRVRSASGASGAASPHGADFREVKRASHRQRHAMSALPNRTNNNGDASPTGDGNGNDGAALLLDDRHSSKSIALEIAGRHDSDIDFTWTVFFWQWFYHQWYPFTLPIYLWREGYVRIIAIIIDTVSL